MRHFVSKFGLELATTSVRRCRVGSHPDTLGRLSRPAVLLGLLGAWSLGLANPRGAQASVILDPTVFSTTGSTFGGAAVNTVNQSTLNTKYVSNSTDFTSYTATATATEGNVSAGWIVNNSDGSAAITDNIVLSLGGTYTINGFALWNEYSGYAPFSVTNFTLTAFSTSALTGGTVLGSYSATATGTSVTIPAQDFSFSPTSASYLEMSFTVPAAGFDGYVQTAVSVGGAVPEPASLSLLGIGATALLGRRRRMI